MSFYYANNHCSSQEDDNFGLSEDSYLDNDLNQMSTSNAIVDRNSDEYKKRRQKNNEGKFLIN